MSSQTTPELSALASRLYGKIPTPPPFDRLPDGVCPFSFPLWYPTKFNLYPNFQSWGSSD